MDIDQLRLVGASAINPIDRTLQTKAGEVTVWWRQRLMEQGAMLAWILTPLGVGLSVVSAPTTALGFACLKGNVTGKAALH